MGSDRASSLARHILAGLGLTQALLGLLATGLLVSAVQDRSNDRDAWFALALSSGCLALGLAALCACLWAKTEGSVYLTLTFCAGLSALLLSGVFRA